MIIKWLETINVLECVGTKKKKNDGYILWDILTFAGVSSADILSVTRGKQAPANVRNTATCSLIFCVEPLGRTRWKSCSTGKSLSSNGLDPSSWPMAEIGAPVIRHLRNFFPLIVVGRSERSNGGSSHIFENSSMSFACACAYK